MRLFLWINNLGFTSYSLYNYTESSLKEKGKSMRAILFLFCLAFALLSFEARAESTAFLCESREAAEQIAAKVVISQGDADNVAGPYIAQRVCVYLPQQVTIIIVYRGSIYGTGSFRVQVVGIGQKLGDKPDFFALMRLNEGAT